MEIMWTNGNTILKDPIRSTSPHLPLHSPHHTVPHTTTPTHSSHYFHSFTQYFQSFTLFPFVHIISREKTHTHTHTIFTHLATTHAAPIHWIPSHIERTSFAIKTIHGNIEADCLAKEAQNQASALDNSKQYLYYSRQNFWLQRLVN